MESQYIHKQHNVSVLMYHIVCAAKRQGEGGAYHQLYKGQMTLGF